MSLYGTWCCVLSANHTCECLLPVLCLLCSWSLNDRWPPYSPHATPFPPLTFTPEHPINCFWYIHPQCTFPSFLTWSVDKLAWLEQDFLRYLVSYCFLYISEHFAYNYYTQLQTEYAQPSRIGHTLFCTFPSASCSYPCLTPLIHESNATNSDCTSVTPHFNGYTGARKTFNWNDV